MTLMEQMIERLRAMPAEEQEQVAARVLSEIEDDARWNATTAAHPEAMQRWADQILADDAAGVCEPLDPDKR